MARQTLILPPARGSAGVRQEAGFTLVELMVAIAVLAILTMIAAPAFDEALLGNRLASYSNSFIASAQTARSEAIKRNVTVVLCRSADGTSCAGSGSWQQGWIVLCREKSANPGVCVADGTDNLVLAQHPALPGDYRLNGSAYSIDFLSTGGAQATGGGAPVTLTLCRAAPTPGGQERELKVSATGRTSVEKKTSGTCS